ncbi:hypothetical protein ACSBR1_026615 [Camellia fascicularis]
MAKILKLCICILFMLWLNFCKMQLKVTVFAKWYATRNLSLMGNEEVLTYKDIVLRRTDLDILEFYFTYLSSLFTSQDVLLVPHSVSFWLANCQDVESAKDFVEPLKLSGKELVVFTVTIMMILVGVKVGHIGAYWCIIGTQTHLHIMIGWRE